MTFIYVSFLLEKEGCCMIDRTYVSMYAWWGSFKPMAFVLLLKDVTSYAVTTL